MVGDWTIFPLDHKNNYQWTQISERDVKCKTAYVMILVNNVKWVASQLFGYDKSKLRPLERGHLRDLMFITSLWLVWPAGHMAPHKTNWVTKPGKVTKKFELETYRPECKALTSWAIHNTLYYEAKWQRNGDRFFKILQKG